jgi:hypothetical protein
VAATDHGRCEAQGWRLRRDGTQFWADVVITAIYNDRHQLTGFGKVTRDVTAQRTVEEALRHSAGLTATNDLLRRQGVERQRRDAEVAEPSGRPRRSSGGRCLTGSRGRAATAGCGPTYSGTRVELRLSR